MALAAAAPVHAGAPAADPALVRDLAKLAPQRPGHPDLFVLGFAGDGSEAVFHNEVMHLEALAAQRLDAAGRVLVLANHPVEPIQRRLPQANRANLRAALAGIAGAMDTDEDLLLLYLTTHGTEDHELLLRREGDDDRLLDARDLRKALDDAGIRHRVVVISACYSGGLVRGLHNDDTLLLTAAHRDRPSFGCGNDSVATYFGRAWLVDALNQTVDFIQAFGLAAVAIEVREMADGLPPSRPQINRGARIVAKLDAWRAGFTPGSPLPYPYAEPEDGAPVQEASAREVIPPLLPADSASSR